VVKPAPADHRSFFWSITPKSCGAGVVGCVTR
jgi:hypothetical protein